MLRRISHSEPPLYIHAGMSGAARDANMAEVQTRNYKVAS